MSLRLSLALLSLSSLALAKEPARDQDIVDRINFQNALESHGLYEGEDFPRGCLDWSGSPKGDSVLYAAKLLNQPRCKGIAPVKDRWIMDRENVSVWLIAGPSGTQRLAIGDVAAGGREGSVFGEDETEALLGTSVDARDENVIDVILAGGGGSFKKARPSRQQERDEDGYDAIVAGGSSSRRQDSRSSENVMTVTGGVGFGTGGRAGWGTGNGGARKGPMALGTGGTGRGIAIRGKIDPPKSSDIELSGDAGARSPESILRVIRAHVGGFRYSYEAHLRNNPNLGGRLTLKFTIAPSGDIVAISIAGSNTRETTLDDEIVVKARRMKFDQIEKGNVVVTYSMVLEPQ